MCAALTIQKVAEAGITPTYAAAAAGGDTIKNSDGDVLIHIKNTNVSTRTVTITPQRPTEIFTGFGSMTKATPAVIVPVTTGDKMIGPFPALTFNDGANNLLLTYDAVSGVTIGAFRLPRSA